MDGGASLPAVAAVAEVLKAPPARTRWSVDVGRVTGHVMIEGWRKEGEIGGKRPAASPPSG